MVGDRRRTVRVLTIPCRSPDPHTVAFWSPDQKAPCTQTLVARPPERSATNCSLPGALGPAHAIALSKARRTAHTSGSARLQPGLERTGQQRCQPVPAPSSSLAIPGSSLALRVLSSSVDWLVGSSEYTWWRACIHARRRAVSERVPGGAASAASGGYPPPVSWFALRDETLSCSLQSPPDELETLMGQLIAEWKRQARAVLTRYGYQAGW